MKRVFTGSTLHDTVHLKNLLEQAGIGCLLKNRHLGSALGDVPFLDCSPEIWVLDDAQAKRAESVLREAQRPLPPAALWRCERCAEDNEQQFAVCWKCGSAAPTAEE